MTLRGTQKHIPYQTHNFGYLAPLSSAFHLHVFAPPMRLIALALRVVALPLPEREREQSQTVSY